MKPKLLLVAIASLFLCCYRASAQPVPDASLGDESSTLTDGFVLGVPATVIEGGARRSPNLFHSFRLFDVEAGQSVYFANPAGISNIFSRVTGDQRSAIDGTLGVNGFANLYFLNPNGIVLGPSARLDTTGSIFMTTADRFRFTDGSEYSANPARVSDVLTVSGPLGLQQLDPADLPQQGRIESAANLLLFAQPSLTFLSNDIEIKGFIATLFPTDLNFVATEDIALRGVSAMVQSSGGDIALQSGDLIALTEGARVDSGTLLAGSGTLSVASDRLQLSGGSQLISGSSVGGSDGPLTINTDKITVSEALTNISGRQIEIRTRDLSLTEGGYLTNSIIVGEGTGFVDIVATGNLTVGRDSFLIAESFSPTASGIDMSLTVGEVTVEGGFISTASFSDSPGGSLDITATELVSVAGGGFISTGTLIGSGEGGELTIRSPDVIVDNGMITASSIGEGSSGNVNLLDIDTLTVRNNGEISASGVLETSQAGNVVVEAGSILLEDAGKVTTVAPSSNGGNITLTATRNLVLRRGALISAEAGTESASQLLNPVAGPGNGGNIVIRSPFVIAPTAENSDISANAFTGEGGSVQISASGIFGLAFRKDRTPASDITASSEFGTDGLVDLQVLNTDFIQQSVAALPDTPVDTVQLLAGSCLARSRDAEGSFVVSGAGGRPIQPGSAPTARFETGQVRSSEWSPGDLTVEPGGVYDLGDGRIVLSRECS